MRAWILNNFGPVESGPLKIAEVADPAPLAGEIRVKVSTCGICRTDLHLIEGELPFCKLPLTPGHQVVGIVDKLGKGVSGFQLGERAGVAWLFSTCGKCDFCRSGLENLCEEAKFTGCNFDGGFAEYMIAKAGFAYQLPEDYDDFRAAPLLCAGIIGWRSLKLSGAKKGETLGLFGFGASAHIVVQTARYLGIEVFVFSRSKEHQELAKKLGASWAGTADQHPPRPLDRAIVFAPAGKAALDALKHLRKGGTVAINAVYMDNIPEIDYNRLLSGEKTIRSVTNLTRRDAREFLELAPQIPVRTEIEIFEFQDLPKTLLLLKQGRIQGAAVLKI